MSSSIDRNRLDINREIDTLIALSVVQIILVLVKQLCQCTKQSNQ